VKILFTTHSFICITQQICIVSNTQVGVVDGWPTITLFNLSPIARLTVTPSLLTPNDPDSLSINALITRNISRSACDGNSGGIYIAVYGIHGRKSGPYQSRSMPMSTDSCTRRVVKNSFRQELMMIDVLRPLFSTWWAKCAEWPPKVMKRSQRWNNLQICPRQGSNMGGSDLWSNTLPLDPRPLRHPQQELKPAL